MNVSNILELKNVSKRYGDSDFALDNISFSLPYGSIMGYVGENGAGKTTTIGCILKTLFKNSGSISLFGQEMIDNDALIREKTGVVYDGDNFPKYLSAEQLAAVMRGLYKSWDDNIFTGKINDFNINKKQKIKTYSRGMTMKLAIAAALSHYPKLLILDEATSGLDPIMRDEILDILLDFVQDEEHSVLLSSHITGDLEKIADYITFIHNGKIVLSERKDNLIYNYAVLRCNSLQFAGLDKNDIVAYRKRDYQIDVLIQDKKTITKKYKDIVADAVSIDEILLLLVKGEKA
jgi:ABC-2 type transport system ATP-binding protein